MCSSLDELAVVDPATLDDAALREDLIDLTVMANRCYAQTLRRLDTFDSRGSSIMDGFRTAKAWLIGALGIAPATASRWVKAARLLRHLPKLAAALPGGQVSPEHIQQVVRLADRVDMLRLVEVDAVLAQAAQDLDVPAFGQVCQRVDAHLHPDGSDPAAAFDRRGLTLSTTGGLTTIRGLLDPEGAAAVRSALEAMMPPPAAGETRSAAQRRVDALVELARLVLAGGVLPSVGGQRPQVGVLVWPQALSPQTLAALAEAQADQGAAARLREMVGLTDPPPDDTPATPATPAIRDTQGAPGGEAAAGRSTGAGDAGASAGVGAGGVGAANGDDAAAGAGGAAGGAAVDAVGGLAQVLRGLWDGVGWADPPHLSWVGQIPAVVAQRIACDCDIYRVILDPATSQPLDVGRAHRLVPHWIRRALYARDRGCRWPGCQAPVPWTDGHHLDPWHANGHTTITRLVLLCRFHHVLVHEGGWSLDLDSDTNQVSITRPGGIPYHLPRTRAPAPTGPSAHT